MLASVCRPLLASVGGTSLLPILRGIANSALNQEAAQAAVNVAKAAPSGQASPTSQAPEVQTPLAPRWLRELGVVRTDWT